MPTIASENAKPIRQAMTVLCGMDVNTGITPSATSSYSYDRVYGNLTGVPMYTPLMDLSGDGFKNDGSAQPLASDHNGIVGTVFNISPYNISTMLVHINFSAAVDEGTPITLFYYTNESAELKKYVVSKSGSDQTQTATIQSREGRIQLVKIAVGNSWWFNNDSLISCTASLRSVETKRDNPELQISDIEIVGYEPNDILDKVAYIGENVPVYYTAGYPGDMAPVRKFYLSDQIKWEDKKITIKAEDATRFLDNEFAGQYIGDIDGGTGGMYRYFGALHNMVTNAGISHEYQNSLGSGAYSNGDAILLPNSSKRSLIAQAVNLFRYPVDIESTALYFSYVDAGIPKMRAATTKPSDYWTINDIANLSIETDRALKKIVFPWKPAIPDLYVTAVETVSAKGTVIKTTSNPYYGFATSSGTITKISPYKYKLAVTSSANVTGRVINIYEDSRDWIGNGVDTIELNPFYAGVFPASAGGPSVYYGATEQIAKRNLLTYSFTWRGDPRVQPRDYIKVLINGSYVDMTIDTVTLEHTDGGLISQIRARGGWI